CVAERILACTESSVILPITQTHHQVIDPTHTPGVAAVEPTFPIGNVKRGHPFLENLPILGILEMALVDQIEVLLEGGLDAQTQPVVVLPERASVRQIEMHQAVPGVILGSQLPPFVSQASTASLPPRSLG